MINTVRIQGAGYLVDGVSVPVDEKNKDYRKLIKWIEDGGVVEPEFTDGELAIKEYQEACAKCTKEIFEVYSYHTQRNIDREAYLNKNDSEKQQAQIDMNDFINAKRDICRLSKPSL